MLKAKDIMTEEVITVTPETEIIQAARVLLSNHINGVPVVDEDGSVIGIICQSDLIAQQKKFPVPNLLTLLDGYIPMRSLKNLESEIQKIAAETVAQAMTSNPVSVEPDASIEEIAALMTDKYFHTIPVVDKGKLIGIIGKEDVLKTLSAEFTSSA